jgi:hypothetical protein
VASLVARGRHRRNRPRRRWPLSLLLVIPFMLGASECSTGAPQKIAGTVIDRDFIAYSETNIHYRLHVRNNDGSTVWVREPFANWSRCVPGTYFPNCKYPNTRKV